MLFPRGRVRIGVVLLVLFGWGTRIATVQSAEMPPQAGTGAITGIATDETGAAVSDVRIMVTNEATALRREITTGAEGTFTLPLLPAGRYTLRAERTGFAPHEMRRIVVTANEQVTLRVELDVESIVEAVVVTAQKRGDERLQDVPVPVTVLDAQKLAQNGEVLLRDYYARVPSLSLTANIGFRQNLTLRGITSGGDSNPTVGIVIDDVPFGASFNRGGALYVPEIDPGDLARVEVLRGPQGTLYGASSMGGLLKFVTKDPSPDKLEGRWEVGTGGVENGSSPGFNLRGSVNVPLGATSGLRVSGFTRGESGYIDNPVTGEHGLNDARSYGFRASALWQPSAALSFKVAAIYQRIEQDGLSEINVPTAGFAQTEGLGDLEQNYLAGSGGFDREVQAYSAIVKWKPGRAEVTSITGFNENWIATSFDRSVAQGASVFQRFGVSGVVDEQTTSVEKWSQELRLSTPLGSRADLLLAGFFTGESTHGVETMFAADTDGRFVGLDWYLDFPRSFNEYAAFANLTYRFTERFDLQIGGRQSWLEEHDDAFIQSGPRIGPVASITPPIASKADAFTYLVTPRYKVSPDLMIYGRLASGYRSGGPNNPAPPHLIGQVPAQYEPDKTQNYEVGVKGTFVRESLSIDASIYHIDWEDLQLRFRSPDLSFNYTDNFSRATSRGAELSVTARLLESLTATGWVAYTDAVLTETLPLRSPIVGSDGDRLPDSPKFSSSVSLRKEFPLGQRVSGFVEGGAAYAGDRFGIFQPTALRQVYDAYTKLDARIGVRFDAWGVNLFVNNLSDTRGVIGGGIGYQPPFGFIQIPPRTFGLTMTHAF